MQPARILFAASALSLAAFAAPSIARADCAAPRSYNAHVDGNTVTICSGDPTAGCPQPGGMLRLDTSSGAVVKLPDACDGDAGPGSCYVDQCVAPGTYEYGFATPYACCTSCCGTDYFTHATITQALGGCASDAGAPTSVSGAPWDAGDPEICSYAGGQDSGPVNPNPTSDGGGAVTFRPDSGATNPSSNTGGGGGSSGGCSLVAPVGAEHAVLGVDAMALVVGLGLLAKKRRSARTKTG